MLIEVNATLRLGATLIPLILMSEGRHLSNVAGTQKESPV
jgi:hypothetical protein